VTLSFFFILILRDFFMVDYNDYVLNLDEAKVSVARLMSKLETDEYASANYSVGYLTSLLASIAASNPEVLNTINYHADLEA
jgi:hypothetical protein